jgi:hypothetical protein
VPRRELLGPGTGPLARLARRLLLRWPRGRRARHPRLLARHTLPALLLLLQQHLLPLHQLPLLLLLDLVLLELL